ncbi:MAG: class I SAM-dependent methyltransferase [Chloroflexi bacterium]|jgi:ubiquinone/menaquinone biosynthesis C-methylase UbiE|nr:class I SAM-dependent methyltransferase [Chloroflexota bacterium]
MEHADHVNLLRPAEMKPGGSWADLGAGSGAFTFALRELAGPTANIYAVDKDSLSLNELEREYGSRFGTTANLHVTVGDFSKELKLPVLDGILMANSLHFFRNPVKVLEHVRSFLKPGGMLLVVEYNVDSGNSWVPYPLSYGTYFKLAVQADFTEPRLLATIPSRFLREFYSAASYNK